MPTLPLKKDEAVVFALRALYEKYGYRQYKMSKFEEYDLYVRNKEFLISENIITFTDTDGKLMALKPDVTLSIVKNDKDKGALRKVYYDETVYRVSKGTRSFRELRQTGVECLGDIGAYSVFETVSLAANSLNCIASDFAMDISHLAILSGVFDYVDFSASQRKEMLVALGEKNAQQVALIAGKAGVSESDTALLTALVSVYGKGETVFSALQKFAVNEQAKKGVNELTELLKALENTPYAGNISVDFSVVSDTNYYNGVAFKGYIKGIPTAVLSGGEYSALMKKMQKTSGGIGFAVYLDELEIMDEESEFDVDTLLVYSAKTPVTLVSQKVEELQKTGSVLAVKQLPEKLKYKTVVKIDDNGREVN